MLQPRGPLKDTPAETASIKTAPSETHPLMLDPLVFYAAVSGGLFKAPSQKPPLTKETPQKHALLC